MPGRPKVLVATSASGRARQAGDRYAWYFGDGTRQVTEVPTTTHTYDGPGPNLPRVVVTAPGGGPTLVEAAEPVTVTAR